RHLGVADALGERQHVVGAAAATVQQNADGAGVLDGWPAPQYSLALVDHTRELITRRACPPTGRRGPRTSSGRSPARTPPAPARAGGSGCPQTSRPGPPPRAA